MRIGAGDEEKLCRGLHHSHCQGISLSFDRIDRSFGKNLIGMFLGRPGDCVLMQRFVISPSSFHSQYIHKLVPGSLGGPGETVQLGQMRKVWERTTKEASIIMASRKMSVSDDRYDII